MYSTPIPELYELVQKPGALTRRLQIEHMLGEVIADRGVDPPVSERGADTIPMPSSPTVPGISHRAVRP